MGQIPTPTWAGSATISGRTITRTSGDAFTDGYPGASLFFLFNPSVLSGIVNIPPLFIDAHGNVFYQFRTWFVDSNHLALEIDATYDLLLPGGTAGSYAPAVELVLGQYLGAGPLQSYNSANCEASGSAITWKGGDLFDSTLDLSINPVIYVEGSAYAVTSFDSTDLVISGSLSGSITVIWLAFGIPAPAVGATVVKGVTISAARTFSSHATPGDPAVSQCGFTAYPSDQWQFSATVRGNTTISTSVTWSCSLGSINTSTGAWTAPSSPAGYTTVTVTATSNQDGTTVGQIFFQLAP